MTEEREAPRRCPCRICIRLWGAFLNWRYARRRRRWKAANPPIPRRDG